MKRNCLSGTQHLPTGLSIRRPDFPHEWAESDKTRPGEAAGRLRGAHVAITNRCRIDAPVFRVAPALELVAVSVIGTDWVGKEAARSTGVPVTNVTGYAAGSVAVHALALLLALAPPCDRAVAGGRWAGARQLCLFDYPILDLSGHQLGTVRAGAVGSAAARKVVAFSMEPAITARKGAPPAPAASPSSRCWRARGDLDPLPLNDETRGLIDRVAFVAMRWRRSSSTPPRATLWMRRR